MSEYKKLVSDTLSYAKAEAKRCAFSRVAFSSGKPAVIAAPKSVPPKTTIPKSAPPPPAPAPKTKLATLPAQDEWKKAVSRNFPGMTLKESPPEDTKAKEIASRWKKYLFKSPVLMLAFGEKEDDLTFLKNLAKAINTHLKPVKLLDGLTLEKDKKWEMLFELNNFELVLAFEAGLTAELKRLYTAGGKIPFLFLTPESKKEKAALWKKLCQILKK